MKKSMKVGIGALVVAGVIGVTVIGTESGDNAWKNLKEGGTSFFLGHTNIVGDTIDEFLSSKVGTKFDIDEVKNQGMDEAYWQLESVNKDKTEFTGKLVFALNGGTLEIPTSSKIIKGDVKADGEEYNYGKIETNFDLSGIREYLGEGSLPDDHITSTIYLKKNGGFFSDLKALPIEMDGIDFKGIDFLIKGSALNNDIDANLEFKGLKFVNPNSYRENGVTIKPMSLSYKEQNNNLVTNFNSSGITLGDNREKLIIQPWSFSSKLNSDHKISGESSIFNAELKNTRRNKELGALTIEPIKLSGDAHSSPLFVGSLAGQNILGQISLEIPSILLTSQMIEGKIGLNHVLISSSLQENKHKLFDSSVRIKGNIQGEAIQETLAFFGIDIAPKFVDVKVDVNNLTTDLINFFGNIQNYANENKQKELEHDMQTVVIESLQNEINAKIVANISTTDGIYNFAKVDLSLLPAIKTFNFDKALKDSSFDNVIQSVVKDNLQIKLDAAISKQVADVLRINRDLKRFNIQPQEGLYQIKLDVTNKKAILNGKNIVNY